MKPLVIGTVSLCLLVTANARAKSAPAPSLLDADVCPTPEDGPFEPRSFHEYKAVIRRTLFAAFPSRPELHVVVQPSFSPVFMIGIEGADYQGSRPRAHRVRLVRLRRNIWNDMMAQVMRQPAPPATLDDTRERAAVSKSSSEVDVSVAGLKEATARKLSEVWKGILRRTQYVEEVIRDAPCFIKVDGTIFHLWGDSMSGSIHSPVPGSLLEQFTAICDQLKDFAVAPPARRGALENELMTSLDRIAVRIRANEPCLRSTN